jgi:hypothetical protein
MAVAALVVQDGVSDKVIDAVDLVHGVLVRVEAVGMNVELRVVAPAVDRLGDGVLPVIVVKDDMVGRCRRRQAGEDDQHESEDGRGG